MSVILRTSDNQDFKVDRPVAERSMLLKNMLEDIGDSSEPIPLPNVEGPILQKVIEYCTYHVADLPLPPEDERDGPDRLRRGEEHCDWDAEFVKVPMEELFDIILAANYLDIKSLLDLGCQMVARTLKGKTAPQIREMFGIENDFTPEEEEQIARENEWAADA